MNFTDIFSDKQTKPKEKTELLSQWLADHPDELEALIGFAEKSKAPVKASCIEAMEFATRTNASMASLRMLEFVSGTLQEQAPRIKWESAKVVGNIAHVFPEGLDEALVHLLNNAEHEGTVVRWSAAFALGEILKLRTARNKELLPAIEAICAREEKNSIRKIYEKAKLIERTKD